MESPQPNRRLLRFLNLLFCWGDEPVGLSFTRLIYLILCSSIHRWLIWFSLHFADSSYVFVVCLLLLLLLLLSKKKKHKLKRHTKTAENQDLGLSAFAQGKQASSPTFWKLRSLPYICHLKFSWQKMTDKYNLHDMIPVMVIITFRIQETICRRQRSGTLLEATRATLSIASRLPLIAGITGRRLVGHKSVASALRIVTITLFVLNTFSPCNS